MSDEKPVPVTLETVAEQIGDFRKSVDSRFAQIDRRFDELKAQLRTETEAVRGDVKLVYDVVIAQDARNNSNDKDHEGFRKQLDKHDVRIVALEKNDRRV